MAWLYILLGILLLIIFILLLRIRVSLSMQGEDIRLDVRVLCFRFRIFRLVPASVRHFTGAISETCCYGT